VPDAGLAVEDGAQQYDGVRSNGEARDRLNGQRAEGSAAHMSGGGGGTTGAATATMEAIRCRRQRGLDRRHGRWAEEEV
jgi:hypothetical protein